MKRRRRGPFNRPFGTKRHGDVESGSELPGYCQISLREKHQLVVSHHPRQ